MTLRKVLVSCILFGMVALSVFLASSGAAAIEITSTPSALHPTFDPTRLRQPPTVVPPAQADNGAQAHWSMCMSCHGDHGQGLTDEWRESYGADYRDCWQSGCHGSDHAGGTPQFWDHIHFEDRAVALWEELARRYKDEPAVAMYGIMNEPEARDVAKLNRYYQRVTNAIRAIDQRHLLNFEGNNYSQDFSQLEPPPNPNVAYSSHLYVNPGLDDAEYPTSDFNRSHLEQVYQQRRAYCAKHNVPHYISEFGPVYNDPRFYESKFQVMSDYLDVIESYGDHWTIWNYKDLGRMGIVTVDADSPWMKRIQPVHRVKTELRADSWIDRASPELDSHLRALATHLQSRLEALPGAWNSPLEELGFTVGDRFVSHLILPAFAEQFRGISESEIDALMASFDFANCNRRTAFENIIKDHTT